MVLGAHVYDQRGFPLLECGETLTKFKLIELSQSPAAEIFIEDPDTPEITIRPNVTPFVEAQAMQALDILLTSQRASGQPLRNGSLIGIAPRLRKIVGCVYPEMLGDAAVSGSQTPSGYEHIHPIKVAELSMIVARISGAEQEEAVTVALAAALMNIGYNALPPGLLSPPRPLDDGELTLVRTHPEHSVRILQDSGIPTGALEAIADHHERWDGKGYPRGLKGHSISLYARIIGIADTYIALCSRRPHQPMLPPHQAIEFIVAYSGELFDPELVKIFAREMAVYPVGVTVSLNTGEGGVVSSANIGHIARPLVRVLRLHGQRVKQPYDLDLAESENQRTIVVDVDG